MVDELISAAWKARREFMFDIEPLEASVRRAKALGAPGQLPVVLLDHYDNCASGGTMDTTDTLREIIRQDLDDVVFFGIYDPDAVEQAVRLASARLSRCRSARSWRCRNCRWRARR